MSHRTEEPPKSLARTHSTRSVHSLRSDPAPNRRYSNSVSFDRSPEVPEKPKNALSPGSRSYKAKSNRQSLVSRNAPPASQNAPSVTPIGRVHGLPRKFVGGRKRIEALLYGGKHYVMEMWNFKMGPVHLTHILARATSEEITRRLEYHLGMFPDSLNLDCSQNIASMSPTQHTLYDSGKTAWLMSPAVLDQLLEIFERRSRFTAEERQAFEMQAWEYQVVSLSKACPSFIRESHPGAAQEIINFPYNVRIKSQVHPAFVFMSTTTKLLALALDYLDYYPDYHQSDYSDAESESSSELSDLTDSPCPSRGSTMPESLPMSRSESIDFSAALSASTSIRKHSIANDDAAGVALRTRRRYTTKQASTSNAFYATNPVNTPDNPFYDDIAPSSYITEKTDD
ncbi:uncharacterized protein LAESUDRAFT_718484 [Laetiporus sulphureus 93-53]|uniref:Uncharacterized protein n=1 Tax=Laetiporus sulphureus 93-53 TaxID=1314785 RepID=A0A165AX61_9APHY|nr:uncharacterized protein LAESUDRAFT_718484 [Laetiporus sulphureus 93-53]KZS99823.1 hypothetical protein LAESUDRAFT_718484 [Laetiporus sulphureus 93-53]